jgi:hypothetical protein
MKTDYIYDMPAGKDLDILIAEKVMMLCVHNWAFIPTDDEGGVGRTCQKCHMEFWGLNPPIYGGSYGSYSTGTGIGVAWEVVEKMGPSYELKAIHHPSGTVHRATFWHGMTGFPVEAETPRLAICRSALLAMTYSLEE